MIFLDPDPRFQIVLDPDPDLDADPVLDPEQNV
jgi:hypothetical protein